MIDVVRPEAPSDDNPLSRSTPIVTQARRGHGRQKRHSSPPLPRRQSEGQRRDVASSAPTGNAIVLPEEAGVGAEPRRDAD